MVEESCFTLPQSPALDKPRRGWECLSRADGESEFLSHFLDHHARRPEFALTGVQGLLEFPDLPRNSLNVCLPRRQTRGQLGELLAALVQLLPANPEFVACGLQLASH